MSSKSVLITGGSGGIGQGLAQKFKESNFKVYVIDRQNSGNSFVDVFFQIDLNQFVISEGYRSIKSKELKKQIVELDVLINNAAIQILGKLEEIELDEWQQTMNVNLTAPFILSQLFLEELQKAHGSIINIGSIHQQLTKESFISYATSKSALIGLTKAMAVDLKDKVRINSISPAAIETDMLRAGFDFDESSIDELRKIHPVQRIGSTQDVDNLAIFIATENRGFLHGANIQLDGGISSVLRDLET